MRCFLKTLSGRVVPLNIECPVVTLDVIKKRVEELEGVPCSEQLLKFSSKILLNEDCSIVDQGITIELSLGLCGGKGGFGSLLRGAPSGPGIKKTTNHDACRDLSGRRMRHVNAEKKLKEWAESSSDRKRRSEVVDSKMEKKVSQDVVQAYEAQYHSQVDCIRSTVSDSVEKGMMALRKRPNGEKGEIRNHKRPKIIWDELLEEEEEEEDADMPTCGEEEKVARQQHDELSTSTTTITTTTTASATDDSATAAEEETSSAPIVSKKNISMLKPSSLVGMPNPKLDLGAYTSVEHLEECVSAGDLKEALSHLGMKCGGNVHERAARLWQTRGASSLEKWRDLPGRLFVGGKNPYLTTNKQTKMKSK